MEQNSTSMRWLIDYSVLFCILFLYGINIYVLTSINVTPPAWDEAVHLRDSVVFYHVLTHPSQITLKVVQDLINKSERYPLIRPSGYYPPFVPILTSFTYCFFGTSTTVAIMSNMIFFAILIFSIYEIGTLLFNRIAGLLASIFILSFPIVVQNSAVYMLDLPLTAMIAFGMFTLLKSKNFYDTRWSIISGFSFGLGILTKWTYLFFLIGPLCYSAFIGFYRKHYQKNHLKHPDCQRKLFRNVVLFTVVSLATFGPYYIPILSQLLRETLKYSRGVLASGPDTLLSLASISFYPMALWKEMITPFGVVLFTLGMAALVVSKNNSKMFLLIFIIVPYSIFTFIIENKSPRHMMPWLVPIALLSAFGVSHNGSFIKFCRWRKIKRYAIFFSLLLFTFLFLQAEMRLKNVITNSSKEQWYLAEIVSALEEDMTRSIQTNPTTHLLLYVGVIPDHHRINAQTLRYYTTRRGLPLNVIKLQTYTDTALEEFVNKFDRYDYIVTKGSPNIAIPAFQQSLNGMHAFFNAHIHHFQHLSTFQEPDGSVVSVFRRRAVSPQ